MAKDNIAIVEKPIKRRRNDLFLKLWGGCGAEGGETAEAEAELELCSVVAGGRKIDKLTKTTSKRMKEAVFSLAYQWNST